MKFRIIHQTLARDFYSFGTSLALPYVRKCEVGIEGLIFPGCGFNNLLFAPRFFNRYQIAWFVFLTGVRV